MKEFVEECRREWKRLGVPDSVANEMAADLAADLEEAEAEGVSPEEVLGSGAFDPRSFAAAWAAESGVSQPLQSSGGGPTRSSRLVAAIGTLALVLAIAGAVLVLVDSPSDPARWAFAAPPGPQPVAVRVSDAPRPALLWSADGRVVLLPRPPSPSALVMVDADDSGVDSRTAGSVLLILGLAALVPSTLFLMWLGLGRGRAAGRTPTAV